MLFPLAKRCSTARLDTSITLAIIVCYSGRKNKFSRKARYNNKHPHHVGLLVRNDGGLFARMEVTAELQQPLHLCARPLLGERDFALGKPFLAARYALS